MTTQPGDPAYQVERLRGALVTPGPHRQLYATSVTFQHAIDMLASSLPLMVDAIATYARAADEDMALRIELAKRWPWPTAGQVSREALRLRAGVPAAPLVDTMWHDYETGPDDLCNRTACRKPHDHPVHHPLEMDVTPLPLVVDGGDLDDDSWDPGYIVQAPAPDPQPRILRGCGDRWCPGHEDDRDCPPLSGLSPHAYRHDAGRAGCQVEGCTTGPFSRVHAGRAPEEQHLYVASRVDGQCLACEYPESDAIHVDPTTETTPDAR